MILILRQLILLSVSFGFALGAIAQENGCAESYGWLDRTRAKAQLYRGQTLAKLDQESLAIFERVRANPEMKLTTEELAHLRERGLEPGFDAYQNTNETVQKINRLVALSKRSQPIPNGNKKPWAGYKKWATDAVDFVAYGATGKLPLNWYKTERWFLDYLGAFLAPSGRFTGPTRYAAHVYTKALREDNFVLGKYETMMLKRYGFLEDFQRFTTEAREYRKDFLTLSEVRDAGDALKWGVALTAAGAVAAGPLVTERITDAEALEKKVSGIKGGVQLMFSDDPRVPPILRTRTQAVIFNANAAKFVSGEKLAAFDRELAESDVNYNRVVINATSEEVNKVMAKAKEFVTRTRDAPPIEGQKTKVLDSRSYVDSGLAESYKILQSELGFPPAPIVKRYPDFMSAYFGLMKVGGSTRVKDVFAARVSAESETPTKEALGKGAEAYIDSMLYVFSPKLMGGGALTVDSLPNTLRRTEAVIPEKKPGPPVAPKPAVPVSE